MRSNGLTASAYTPVADLDPRVADAFLTDLKEQGVAAYTKPVESTTTSGFDRPEFRVNVQDRLYVDAAESERVKAMLSDQDPDLVSGSDDLTWAQIVAGFDRPPSGDDVHPWPVTEDLDWSGREGGDPDTGPWSPDGTAPREDAASPEGATSPEDLGPPRNRRAELRGWLSSRDATATGADEATTAADGAGDRREDGTGSDDMADQFVPEPPPPLPQLEPWQQLAWVGVVGGPLLLVVAVLFSIQLPTWASLAAVAGFVGGFITLVARMDDGDSEDDSGNGAVV